MNDKMLNTLLQTPEVYRRIISKIISNSYISDDIALINNLNNYIINNEVNEKYLNEYILFLYNLFKVNNNIVFKFNIFDCNELFTQSQRMIINDIKYKLTNKAYDLSLKFLNNEILNIEDKYLVLDFFNSKINDIKYKNYCDTMYNYLLNNYKEEYLSYIINYTTSIVCNIYNVEYFNIYFSHTDINNAITITDKDNIKYINKITNNIYDVVINVKKYKNNYSLLDRFESSKDILFKEYLSNEEYDNYFMNYKHNESNYYDDIDTWQVVIFILKKYSKVLYDELHNIKQDSLIKYYYKTIYITNNKLVDKAKYNVDKLDMIVKNNPFTIIKYPILNAIYKANGDKLNIFEILNNEYNLNEKYIFNDYLTEYIQTGNLKKLDINKLATKDKSLLIEKITILIKIELNELLNNFKLYKILDKEDLKIEERKIEYDNLNFNRINKIRYYINYLNDNKEIIDKISIDKEYKISKNMKDINKQLNEAKKNINDKHCKIIQELKEVTLYGE